MNDDELKVSKDIYRQFINPNSELFLETNTEKIFQAAKNDANLYPVSRDEILTFKKNLELSSRNFEQRTLGNWQPRYLNYKSYISFSPRSIICGDLLFVKSLKHLAVYGHFQVHSFIHSFIHPIIHSFDPLKSFIHSFDSFIHNTCPSYLLTAEWFTCQHKNPHRPKRHFSISKRL